MKRFSQILFVIVLIGVAFAVKTLLNHRKAVNSVMVDDDGAPISQVKTKAAPAPASAEPAAP